MHNLAAAIGTIREEKVSAKASLQGAALAAYARKPHNPPTLCRTSLKSNHFAVENRAASQRPLLISPNKTSCNHFAMANAGGFAAATFDNPTKTHVTISQWPTPAASQRPHTKEGKAQLRSGKTYPPFSAF